MESIKTPIYLVILTVLFSVSTGCNTPEFMDYAAAVEGNWNAEEITYTGTAVTELNGSQVEIPFEGEGYDMSLTATFERDPNTLTSSGTFNMRIRYSLLGVQMEEEWTGLEFISSGSWENSGKEIIIKDDQGQASTFEIIKATDTELILETQQTEEQQVDGTTYSVDILARAVFSKVQ